MKSMQIGTAKFAKINRQLIANDSGLGPDTFQHVVTIIEDAKWYQKSYADML